MNIKRNSIADNSQDRCSEAVRPNILNIIKLTNMPNSCTPEPTNADKSIAPRFGG